MTITTENLDAMVQFLTDAFESSFCDHFKQAADMLRAQQQRLVEFEARCAMTLGVGDGRGQLFVHGDGDSIRACRDKLLHMEELAAKVADLERQAAIGRLAVEMLHSMRWHESDSMYDVCQSCGGPATIGCDNDCELAAILRDAEQAVVGV